MFKGLTLQSNSIGRCTIGRIIHGGLIDKTGLAQLGDELIEINGETTDGHSIETIQKYLLAFQGEMLLKLYSSKKKTKRECETIFVRAMFDYNPNEDEELPCSDIGLPFKIHDILEIKNNDDFTWWQARSLNDSLKDSAKLIPSAELQETRVIRSASYLNELNETPSLQGSSILQNLHEIFRRGPYSTSTSNESRTCDTTETSVLYQIEKTFSRWLPFQRKSFREQQRKQDFERSRMAHSRSSEIVASCSNESRHSVRAKNYTASACPEQRNHSCSNNEPFRNATVFPSLNRARYRNLESCIPFLYSELPFQPYEEVICMPYFRRKSLVLLGAQGVGRRALRRSLVAARPDKFSVAVPHTTRQPNLCEVDGINYHFVQREEMANYILNKEFLEFGQKKNIMFGTRLDTVRNVIASGLLPVLDVEPKALRILRCAEFAPIIIFVVPPCLNLLTSNSTNYMLNGRLTKLAKESEVLEYLYRPYSDYSVIHHSLEDTTQDIIDFVLKFQESEQWVPIRWIF